MSNSQNYLFNYFLPILCQMKIFTPPHLCSTSDEAFTSKMNGAWASQTHWTSFKHKPPQPILLAETLSGLCYSPWGSPQPRHTGRLISCWTKQRQRAETRDKSCDRGSVTLIGMKPSRASAGQLCCSRAEQLCAPTIHPDCAGDTGLSSSGLQTPS